MKKRLEKAKRVRKKRAIIFDSTLKQSRVRLL